MSQGTRNSIKVADVIYGGASNPGFLEDVVRLIENSVKILKAKEASEKATQTTAMRLRSKETNKTSDNNSNDIQKDIDSIQALTKVVTKLGEEQTI